VDAIGGVIKKSSVEPKKGRGSLKSRCHGETEDFGSRKLKQIVLPLPSERVGVRLNIPP
jgi:hypothetical protein